MGIDNAVRSWNTEYSSCRAFFFALLVLLCVVTTTPSRASDLKDDFPVPADVSRIVVWTRLCGEWTEKILHDSEADVPVDATQKEIETMPHLFWAQSHCNPELLDSQIQRLHEIYKNDPIVTYVLYNFLGSYKD